MSEAEVDDLLDSSCRAGKHNEFFEASSILALDELIAANCLIKSAVKAEPSEVEKVTSFIQDFFKQNQF